MRYLRNKSKIMNFDASSKKPQQFAITYRRYGCSNYRSIFEKFIFFTTTYKSLKKIERDLVVAFKMVMRLTVTGQEFPSRCLYEV